MYLQFREKTILVISRRQFLAHEDLAGVRDDGLAGDAAGPVGGQKDDGIGDILALDFLVEGGLADVEGDDLFGLDAVFFGAYLNVVGVPDFGAFEDVAGADAVDADVVLA